MNMRTTQREYCGTEVIIVVSPIRNGVKQCGVLSPILICVYIDVLLIQLRKEVRDVLKVSG